MRNHVQQLMPFLAGVIEGLENQDELSYIIVRDLRSVHQRVKDSS